MSNNAETKVVPPETAGFSAKRLERIDELVRGLIANGDLPGAVTLVMRHGQVVHYNAQGFMDIESKKSLAKDCLFRMYSMTKPVTATAIMMLYEEGKLMLDDAVSKFIPAFANQTVIVHQPPEGKALHWPPGRVYTTPIEREVTIRDLLTHTAGLASLRLTPAFFIKELSDAVKGSLAIPRDDGSVGPEKSVRETIEKLARIPLSFQPGTDWNYGFEFAALGVVIEIISGKSLEQFFQERIFKPLAMKDSSFILAESKIDRLVTEYTWDDSWKLKVKERPQDSIKLGTAKNVFSGMGEYGGILSTAADYLRFCRMLLNRGELDGVRLLGSKSVDLMAADHIHGLFVYPRGYGWGYGFGMSVRTDLTGSNCVGSVGAYGWSGMACTYFVIDPTEQLIGLVFSQVLGYGFKPGFCFHQQFEKAMYQAKVKD
jgi:CubicO group peptidase (beta-lactamase class C family)